LLKSTADESPSQKPRFLITIDTEGDNLWSRPSVITTKNSEYLPRFQQLCEHYRLKPTWLVNYEMTKCPVFVEFARDVIQRQAGEIGMHLHAWNSPPIVPLTSDDYRFQPYLIDYPMQVIRDKVNALTDLLEDTFQTSITSHRAGRWALDSRYAEVLANCGYRVDCSVTPHVSWASMEGAPGCFGSNYIDFPDQPYRVDLDDIRSSGASWLIELPMTIHRTLQSGFAQVVKSNLARCPARLVKRVAARLLPDVHWLRPNGSNLKPMLHMLDNVVWQQDAYAQMMLHSSELMPGGSPRFRSVGQIERLYDHLNALFAGTKRFVGAGLSDFAAGWSLSTSPSRNMLRTEYRGS
jgi:hypothetical protein